MPDLTIEIMQQCAQLGRTSVSVTGSKGATYTVTPDSCTCLGFQYRHYCKHIELAVQQRCSWHELYGDAIEQDGICPDCGGPTEYVRVAV